MASKRRSVCLMYIFYSSHHGNYEKLYQLITETEYNEIL